MKFINIEVSDGKVNLSKETNNKVIVAIGNFDGLHKGHQKLLKETKEKASNLKLPFGIITFDPHPRDFFSHSKHNFLLTDFLEKKRLFKEFGVDYFFNIKFNDMLRNLSPEEFVEIVLKNTINVNTIYGGENFKFGKNRSGSLLDKKIFNKYNINALSFSLFTNKNSQIISSELIRKSILNLDFKLVKTYLGRNWALIGNIKKGDQTGRKLGFSTANLEITNILEPRYGVYLTNTRIMKKDGMDFVSDYMPSITNFGIRPTLDGQKQLFETHILNYEIFFKNKEIYDCRIYVELLGFLRDEKKFDSFENLKNQIAEDVKEAKLFHKIS